MSSLPKPISLVAEKAARFLKNAGSPVSSRRLIRELLATRSSDEATARRLLETAFAGDPRLVHCDRGWTLADSLEDELSAEQDHVLISLGGHKSGKGQPFELTDVSALRLRGDDVVAACGGDISGTTRNDHLKRALLSALDGAIPVVHDAAGALRAFEAWLGAPLDAPVSLRLLGRDRLGLPARHDLEALAARLGLAWRSSDEPLEQAELLEACMQALRRPNESLTDLRTACSRGAQPIEWSRFAFDREFLRAIPRVPGTYRFYDIDEELLYIGKSKDLQGRINSYFREGRLRSKRVQLLLDRLHRIEYEHSGSELEAILREAEQIASSKPSQNVQRAHHPREGRARRLESILILEPAEPPYVFRAFLVFRGRLIDRVEIGPRGGGLRRIERQLDDYFFFIPDGPTAASGPAVDIELIVRWLGANRDQVVAFDPTQLSSAREVTDRLRWFLGQGSLTDPEGNPIIPR